MKDWNSKVNRKQALIDMLLESSYVMREGATLGSDGDTFAGKVVALVLPEKALRRNLWVKFSKGTILKSFEIQDSHPLQWTVQVTISRSWKVLRYMLKILLQNLHLEALTPLI